MNYFLIYIKHNKLCYILSMRCNMLRISKVSIVSFFLLVSICTTMLAENSLRVWTDNYNRVLKENVVRGRINGIEINLVNYRSIVADSSFKKLYKDLQQVTTISHLSKNERLAFWLNVYNYLVIRKVSEHPKINKMTDLNTFMTSIWDQKIGTVLGEKRSLNGIEHGIIRQRFHDPRIHVALVCAAVSCPDLRREAFRGKTLDQQLNEQLEEFVSNNKKGMHFDPKNRKIYLSSIFSWFKGDFGGNPVIWLENNSYLKKGALDNFSVMYMKYDWTLNAVRYSTTHKIKN